jgi:hypothetical protein
MSRLFWVTVALLLASFGVKAQQPITIKKDSTGQSVAKIDTLKSTTTYVNVGKVAAKKAILRSLIIPGWGQFSNGLNLYRGVKIAAIYTGATLLTLSFIDNNNQYHIYLKELRDRQANGGRPVVGSPYYGIDESTGIIAAKDTYRRNKEVIIFSMVALYGIQVVEAYVDARLKYFDVGNDLTLSPTIIKSDMLYGYNSNIPGIKLSLKL